MATFTIGGGNQGNTSPFLTGKATPMSLPSGYLSSAEQQAARMQKAISGVGADIGDAIAARAKEEARSEGLDVLIKSLEKRAQQSGEFPGTPDTATRDLPVIPPPGEEVSEFETIEVDPASTLDAKVTKGKPGDALAGILGGDVAEKYRAGEMRSPQKEAIVKAMMDWEANMFGKTRRQLDDLLLKNALREEKERTDIADIFGGLTTRIPERPGVPKDIIESVTGVQIDTLLGKEKDKTITVEEAIILDKVRKSPDFPDAARVAPEGIIGKPKSVSPELDKELGDLMATVRKLEGEAGIREPLYEGGPIVTGKRTEETVIPGRDKTNAELRFEAEEMMKADGSYTEGERAALDRNYPQYVPGQLIDAKQRINGQWVTIGGFKYDPIGKKFMETGTNKSMDWNELQTKIGVYRNQMLESEKQVMRILEGFKNDKGMDVKWDPTDPWGVYWDKITSLGLDAWTDPRRLQYEGAVQAWALAKARFDSGAAVPEPEQVRYNLTFFPRVGESGATTRNKKQLRDNSYNTLNIILGPDRVSELDKAIGGSPLGAAGGTSGKFSFQGGELKLNK